MDAKEFVIARHKIKEGYVVSLLLSSSFGINALLYAAWLGYEIGLWALLIQAAWALSFALLSRYSEIVHNSFGIHRLLESEFGLRTRIIAATCTIIGFIYLMGWEIQIGISTLDFIVGENGTLNSYGLTGFNLSLLAVAICVAYSVAGGMKLNAYADVFLNFLKVFLLLAILCLVVLTGTSHFRNAATPSFIGAIKTLGPLGFITNVIFNLLWQFVDNSSWQSIIANKGKTSSGKVIYYSGLIIFFSIGLLGTLFGMLFRNVDGVTPDNILGMVTHLTPDMAGLVSVAVLLTVLCCMMSLLDGMLLSATYTFVFDILARDDRLISIFHARLFILLFGVAVFFGVPFIFKLAGVNLFEFVYVIIIAQLSLFGPIALVLNKGKISPGNTGNDFAGSTSIIIAVVLGLISLAVGTTHDIGYFVDGAALASLCASIIFTYFLTKKGAEIGK